MSNKKYLNSLVTPPPTRGVLTGSEVLLVEVVGGKRVLSSRLLPLDAREAEGLFAYLWQTGLTELWVMPATKFSSTWIEEANKRWTVVVHSAPGSPGRPACVLLWPKASERRDERRLALAFPEFAGWQWALSDATSLLATVTYLDQVLARPLIDAPALVAYQLLSELALEQTSAELHSTSVDLSLLLENPLLENKAEAGWMRPLSLGEQRQKYLHRYNHLSLSLEACLNVQLGMGTPGFSADGRAYDGLRPGLWRTSVELAGSVFDGKRLPSCLEGEWMSTPQVNCCRDIGYHVQVHEGFFWLRSQALLKPWASTLWRAAERLYTRPQVYRQAEGRANSARTIKQLAQIGVDIIAQKQAGEGRSRPDWGAQIAGRRRAALFAHLVGLVRRGTMPVLLDKDAFWVVSDDPHPLMAVPGLVTARPWKGYSIGYEVPLPLSREVKEIFRTVEHADQVVAALENLAGAILPV